jgi:hypothetical protein
MKKAEYKLVELWGNSDPPNELLSVKVSQARNPENLQTTPQSSNKINLITKSEHSFI